MIRTIRAVKEPERGESVGASSRMRGRGTGRRRCRREVHAGLQPASPTRMPVPSRSMPTIRHVRDGAETEEGWFGGILESGGIFRFVSYSNGF